MPDRELKEKDYSFLQRCLELAQEAYEAGDKPFGSVLVNENGKILAEARNRVNEKTQLAHPEFELAKWAAENMSLEERRKATIYTSGEHCPMCAGAHAWAEIGSLVYLSSAQQLGQWLTETGASESPINFIPVEKVIKSVELRGPGKGELLKKIEELQKKANR